MDLASIARKLGVSNRRSLRNPILLTRFARPYGGVVKAHLSEKQARAILNDVGMERWRNEEVLGGIRVNDDTVMAAVLGDEGLINKLDRNPWRGGNASVNTAICGTVALAGLIAINRIRG